MSHFEFHAFPKGGGSPWAWANTFQIEEAPKSMQMSPKPASEPDPQHHQHHHHQPVPVSVSVAESRNSFSSPCHVKCQRRVLRQLSTACLRPRPRSNRLPAMHAEARIFACCPSKFRLKKTFVSLSLSLRLTLCSARTFAVSVIS